MASWAQFRADAVASQLWPGIAALDRDDHQGRERVRHCLPGDGACGWRRADPRVLPDPGRRSTVRRDPAIVESRPLALNASQCGHLHIESNEVSWHRWRSWNVAEQCVSPGQPASCDR